MSDPFDPYAQWLGCAPGTRPGDHYELLGLSALESDSNTITHAADVLIARLRKIRPGSHAAEWQRLLDMIRAAKICLWQRR